ncbi:hypothetical protein GG344DRAFT_60353, partial [Lentinula edodes]
VNGHNPDLLVYTRHNHDLKCILSGKAAKAAMFYISDYITKMPLSTDILLSTLSKAVSSLATEELDNDPVIDSKKLLHRCLTHLSCKQQIHAQQCARYLRRLGDSMFSHQSAILPFGNLMLFVKQVYKLAIGSDGCDNEGSEVDIQLSLGFKDGWKDV